MNSGTTNLRTNVGAMSAFPFAAGQQPLMTFPQNRCNPHYHSFCHECCHPVSACCCGTPHCRKEAKELVVVPQSKKLDNSILSIHRMAASILSMPSAPEEKMEEPEATDTLHLLRSQVVGAKSISLLDLGVGNAFIGGGCCVHLSVEYMPENATASENGVVLVAVTDSEGTVMYWAKIVGAQSGYQIKENIITTNPGAKLMVYAINMIARVRWCEVFSC